jgi:hypothetical protein
MIIARTDNLRFFEMVAIREGVLSVFGISLWVK